MKPLVVSLVGAECTGKSTLARELGRVFSAPVAVEFARVFAEARPGQAIAASDVRAIAAGERALLEKARAKAGRLVVCDTDLLSSYVWATALYPGFDADWLRAEVVETKADLYFLLSPDVGWVFDPIRGPETDRPRIHACFERALAEFGVNAVVLSGPFDKRTADAVRTVAALLHASV